MAVTYTENYNLGKQENHADKFDMAVITENMDKIDLALKSKVTSEPGKDLMTDAEREKLSGLENYNDSAVKSDIALNRATLGYTRRNFFRHSRIDTTINGVEFIANPDGSFTMSGTATQTVSFMLTNFQTIPQGKYLCTGCVGGSSSKYYLRLEPAKSADQSASGEVSRQYDGEDVPVTVSGDYDSIKVNIVVSSGTSMENVRIAPMIRAEYDTDPTYEPYKPSVEERLAALEAAILSATGGEA